MKQIILITILIGLLLVSSCTSTGEIDVSKLSPEDKVQVELMKEEADCNYGFLEEYRCNEDIIEQKYQHSNCSFSWAYSESCSFGCEDVQCKPCYDSDGGKDYYTKGYVYYSGQGKVFDECTDEYKGYLSESYCENDELNLEDYKNFKLGFYECPNGCSDGKCNSEARPTYEVTRVIDGDTIEINTGERVRLIGINAPEEGEKCYEESKEFLEDFLSDKEITLEKDIEDKDQYGRLLRYLFADGHNVNYGMIYLGFAHKYEYGSNTKYSSLFEEAENEAKKDQGCLWKSEEINYIQDQCIYITNFHFNAAGNDNYNLNDEYVTFGNKCSYSISMDSWIVKDETASHIYTIPSFTFYSGATFTLYTGTGANTNSALYWGRTPGDYAAIWNNNGGDTLFLRDSNGNLVLSQSYPGY